MKNNLMTNRRTEALRRDLQILFLGRDQKFEEGAGTLMTPCATSNL